MSFAISEDYTRARATAASLLTPAAQGAPTDDRQLLMIERFLRMEARLLDEERLRDWYHLLAEDLFYWMPLRENRFRRDKRPEISPDNMAFFDESKADIDLRIQRLESGMVWSEDPPTRHTYAISNVEAFETDSADLFEVHSVFIQFRNRSEHDASCLQGRRRDLLRRTENSFLIVRRLILLDQSVLQVKNLSSFF